MGIQQQLRLLFDSGIYGDTQSPMIAEPQDERASVRAKAVNEHQSIEQELEDGALRASKFLETRLKDRDTYRHKPGTALFTFPVD